jgi:hypothetical protein
MIELEDGNRAFEIERAVLELHGVSSSFLGARAGQRRGLDVIFDFCRALVHGGSQANGARLIRAI